MQKLRLPVSKKILLFLLNPIILLTCSNLQTKAQTGSDSLLRVLKAEIQKKSDYDNLKLNRISALKQSLLSSPESDYDKRYHLCNEIYIEYKDYKFDSAYVYAVKLLSIGIQTRDIDKQYESQFKLGAIQLSGGMIKETFDILQQIDIRRAKNRIKLRYYGLKSRALKALANNNSSQFYYPQNQAKSINTLDSALLFAVPGSYEHQKRTAELLALQKQQPEARAILRKLLKDPKHHPHEYAMVAYDLSNLTDGEEKVHFLRLAAIYDIRSSTKQTRALFSLGQISFEQGNVNDAEILLTEALSQASTYGNRLREKEITAVLTRTIAQKLINAQLRKNEILIVLIVMALIMIAGIARVSYVVYSRLKKVRIREAMVQQRNQELDHYNKRLLEDASIKEEYIGYFFNVISGYILKIEKLKRHTERKIKAKNYEELLSIVGDIDIKAEREQLFYTFDSIFLKLFPNFIVTFNALLKPGEQIWPKENELLNTNLRIFALMRLGINDTQTIANILETAVSTIYTYKNRIKSKAIISGAEFDQRIMEIKFVDMSDTNSGHQLKFKGEHIH